MQLARVRLAVLALSDIRLVYKRADLDALSACIVVW